MKISFDFDETLDKQYIQAYALQKKNEGHGIYILTAREENPYNPTWNMDLYMVAEFLGIYEENIIFAEYTDKWIFMKEYGIELHIDGDLEEIELIREQPNMNGVHFRPMYDTTSEWKTQMENFINKK